MEFSVIKPPEQNPDATITVKETTQKNIGFFHRKVVQDVMGKLNNTLFDCAVEIGMGPMLYDSPGKYRVMNYGRVSGMGPEELNAYLLSVKGRFQAWSKRMDSTKALRTSTEQGTIVFTNPLMSKSICERICQQEDSINQIRTRENISEKTAFRLFHAGLNEYAILSGWGNHGK